MQTETIEVTMNYVLVIDREGEALMPCHPARARQLLKAGKAAVHRQSPFTLRLTERTGGTVQPTQLKIDPGATTTGLALVVSGQRGRRVVWAAELTHRGNAIKTALDSRRAQRRSRRQRHTRYRAARFLNRRRSAGWLPPSLRSRIDNILTWVSRLSRWSAIDSLSQELVRFDTQRMQDAETSGIEYQQGTLAGYEIRQYLLEKWSRRCAYCQHQHLPLQIEHIVPRRRLGTDRVSNLTLACADCNQAKGTLTAAEFGHPEVQAQAQRPLRDAAAVNTTRWLLYHRLGATGLPVETGSGGQTQFNRVSQNYPKTHWLDAACVGPSGEHVYASPHHRPLQIKAAGRQRRQMTLVNAYGFPRSQAKASRFSHGFQTGDLVMALVPSGKHAGRHTGRIAIKASGSFTVDGTPDISWRYCRLLQHTDGYHYSKGVPAVSAVA